MRVPRLHKWTYRPELEGMLFFAQLIEEMLFDYTFDSYKPRALNSHFLCRELLSSIDDCLNENIKKGAIKPIVDELKQCLINDPVAIVSLGQYLEHHVNNLSAHESNLIELRNRVNHIYNLIGDGYLDESKRQLLLAIRDPNQKELITKLTRLIVSELLSRGFPKENIYYQTKIFFFDGRYPRIDSLEQTEVFLNRINFEDKDYDIIFKVSNNWIHLQKILEHFNYSVSSRRPRKRTNIIKEQNLLIKDDKYPLYLIAKKIKAYNHHHAMIKVENTLKTIKSLAVYFSHRSKLEIKTDVIIYEVPSNRFHHLKRPTPAILKRPDEPLNRVHRAIIDLVLCIHDSKLNHESSSRLYRTLEHHSTSVSVERLEDQLLNIWSSLEGLMPPTKEEGRVMYIINSIMPFLMNYYIKEILNDLLDDIINCGKGAALKIINNVPEGDTEIEKCAAILTIEENRGLLRDLCAIFDTNPLLKNRLFVLSSRLSNAKNVLRLLNRHYNKVSWHLQRIYRTRNIIIHTGREVEYLDTLVENLHYYLDLILAGIINKVNLNPKLETIEEVVLENKLDYELYLKKLKKYGEENCKSDNFKDIVGLN